eukprot:COSAG01_NODE_4257_length_5203_cov_10.296630_5_plen_34_part_00
MIGWQYSEEREQLVTVIRGEVEITIALPKSESS